MKPLSANIRRAAALLGAALLALAPGARAADPYRIDVITSLTGGASFLGKGEQQASSS